MQDLSKLKILIKEDIEKGVSYEGKKTVSYSQFSMYANCPKRWELAYARNHRKYSPSIHTLFGTSFHETLQNFLTVLFEESAQAADLIDLDSYLKDRLIFNYNKEVLTLEGHHFSNPQELESFWKDGVAILDWIKKRRKVFFSSRNQILLGIEIPIHVLIDPEVNSKVYFVAFLDLVIYDKVFNKIKIIDIKTSTRGWNEKEKTDPVKKAQVMLYKHFFNKRFGIPIENIEAEFFIVRRTLIENAMFPVKRVQSFIPIQGKIVVNKAYKSLLDFVTKSFNPDGSYNLNTEYHAISGESNSNCKFCEFKDKPELCPANKRLETLPVKLSGD